MAMTLEEAIKDTTLADKGHAFYEQHLKTLLEPQHTGQFVAIEPDSGQYFIGPNTIKTMTTAWDALPNKQF